MGIGELAFCVPDRCAHGHCQSPEGSVAGFTGYRLCHRAPIFIVLLYCVVLCCRRDGLGSIYTKRTTEPNGTTETKEPNRKTETDGTIGTTDPNGTAPLWLCGFCGFTALRLCGFVALWLRALWLCGFVALWLCGFMALRLCGFVALWLCGLVALWLCGFVALRLCGVAAL